jgi:hypothetical protein
MRALEAGVAQQVAELRGNRELAGVRPRELVRRREGNIRPEQRLDAHRRGHAGRSHEPVCIREQEGTDGAHHLRPVEQRQPFLRREAQRLQPGLAERHERRQHLTVQLDRAAADQRQREVRQRCQIAGRTNGALRRHDRVDAGSQQGQQQVDDLGTAAAVPQRQGVRAEQQHRPHDLARERRTDAGRVAHQEVLLEPLAILRRHERGG